MRTALAIAAAILLAGCPGGGAEDSSQHSEPRTSTTTQNPQSVPGNSTAMNPVAPPQKDNPSARVTGTATVPIQVQLTEYEIQMPDMLPAGHQMLRITNAGKQNHSFAIDGPGVQTKLSSDLTRGDIGQIAVDLQPGTYTVYCPVDGHRGKGMQRTVTVK